MRFLNVQIRMDKDRSWLTEWTRGWVIVERTTLGLSIDIHHGPCLWRFSRSGRFASHTHVFCVLIHRVVLEPARRVVAVHVKLSYVVLSHLNQSWETVVQLSTRRGKVTPLLLKNKNKSTSADFVVPWLRVPSVTGFQYSPDWEILTEPAHHFQE
jgi:hypothetical protein